MYKSKFEIQKKFLQVKFLYRELQKFENKVFVNNGLDKLTGCYPFEVRLITFIIFTRSIFQYARKEASQNPDQLKANEKFIKNKKIIGFFKNLRDNEIHSLSLSTHTTITLESKLNLSNELDRPELSKISKSENTDKGKINHCISMRMQISSQSIQQLQIEGNKNLLDSFKNGIPLFETVKFEGDSDMFSLCKNYYACVESFIEYGISKGFIS